MVRLAFILAAILVTAPLNAWEVRLFGVRPGASLPSSGAIPQSYFESVRSASPIAVFRLREGETASHRLYDPALSFRVSIAPRQTGGISLKLVLTDFQTVPEIVGSATISHADDYIYLLRPLSDHPIIVQLSP